MSSALPSVSKALTTKPFRVLWFGIDASVSVPFCKRALGAPAGTGTMAASESARGGAHRGCACRVDDSLSSIGAPLSRGSGGLAHWRVSRAGGGRADVERPDHHRSPLRVSRAQDGQPLSLLIPRRRDGGCLR